MNNPTPAAQVAALAELFGITPETHRHLFKVINIGGEDDEAEQWKPRNLPDPLGPDADAVWLAPMMHWLIIEGWSPQVFGKRKDMMFSVQVGGVVKHHAHSATAALLQACLAARVPEVCKILEATHE